MSKTNKNQCKTTDQCETPSPNKCTQVKTVYARAAIILLAVNFCITGYVLSSVMKLQEEAPQPTTTPTASNVRDAQLDEAMKLLEREIESRPALPTDPIQEAPATKDN